MVGFGVFAFVVLFLTINFPLIVFGLLIITLCVVIGHILRNPHEF
jgi:hypothetical protein